MDAKNAVQRPGGPGGTTGMLSLDQLREEASQGTIDTVVTAFTDMQGRLFGKRIQVEYFLDEVTEHGVEGCNYLLALDMDMDPVPGYEMANWEGGYGDFAIVPDLGTLRRVPWLDRTALVLCDVGEPRRLARRRLAAAGPDRPVRAGRGDGLRALHGVRARVLPLQGELLGGARQGLPRPHADDPLHPRLPHPRHHDGRGVPRPDPPRHARRRDPDRVLEGRGLVRAARGEHPLRRRRDLGGPPHDLQERSEGDRLPSRDLRHVHGQAVGEGHRQLVPHPLEPGARRPERLRGRRGGDRRLPPLPGRHAQPHPRAGPVRRPVHQLLQALRDRELGADRRSRGAATTGRVAFAS